MDIQTLISQRAAENNTNEEPLGNPNQPIINRPPIRIPDGFTSNRSTNRDVGKELVQPSRYCPLYIDMVWFEKKFNSNPANLFGLSTNSTDSFIFRKYSSGNLTNKTLNDIVKNIEFKSIIYIYIILYDNRGEDSDDELLPDINITSDKLDKHILIWDGSIFSDYGLLDVYVNIPKQKNIVPENDEFVTLGTSDKEIGSIYSNYINSKELQISLGKIWLGNKYNISIDDDKIKFSKIKLTKIPEKIQQLLDMGAKWPQEMFDRNNAIDLNYSPDIWGNIYANLLLQVPNDNLDIDFKFTDNDFLIENLDINGFENKETIVKETIVKETIVKDNTAISINNNRELRVSDIRDIPSYNLNYLFFNKETNEISFDSSFVPIEKPDTISKINTAIININKNGETLLEGTRDIPGYGLHPVLYNKATSEISIDSYMDIYEMNQKIYSLENIISDLSDKISDLEKNL